MDQNTDVNALNERGETLAFYVKEAEEILTLVYFVSQTQYSLI